MISLPSNYAFVKQKDCVFHLPQDILFFANVLSLLLLKQINSDKGSLVPVSGCQNLAIIRADYPLCRLFANYFALITIIIYHFSCRSSGMVHSSY